MLTFILSYLDAQNLVADPGPWWYLGTVLVDLFIVGGVRSK
jgi:hypothetical protein